MRRFCPLSEFCKFAITRKNYAFDAKIVTTHLTKIFMAIFAPDERLPSSATLCVGDTTFLVAWPGHEEKPPELCCSGFFDVVACRDHN